jgi:hypothetical protein
MKTEAPTLADLWKDKRPQTIKQLRIALQEEDRKRAVLLGRILMLEGTVDKLNAIIEKGSW